MLAAVRCRVSAISRISYPGAVVRCDQVFFCFEECFLNSWSFNKGAIQSFLVGEVGTKLMLKFWLIAALSISNCDLRHGGL